MPMVSFRVSVLRRACVKRRDIKINIHVVTGFLGSGKTTLLNRLIERGRLAKAAFIINELGDVGIDHLVIDTQDDMLLLAGGCVCCSSQSPLVETVSRLLEKVDRGELACLDTIVIETTGVADPGAALQSLLEDPFISRRLKGIQTVAAMDCVHWNEHLSFDEAHRQIALADYIVLTKSDLARDAQIDSARRAANSTNPLAMVLEGDLAGLFTLAMPMRARAIANNRTAHAHVDSFSTLSLTGTSAVSLEALLFWVHEILQGCTPPLLRMKGIVDVGMDTPALIHAVGTTLYPVSILPAWPTERRTSRIVLIGRSLDDVRKRRFSDVWEKLIREK